MKKIVLAALAAVCLVMLASCATIMDSEYDTVRISSNPAGATILVDGMEMGKTPTMLTLEASRTYTVTIQKEGYQAQTAILKKIPDFKWQLLDLFCWPVCGNVIDVLSPKGFDLSPSSLDVYLSPISE